jgi:hypothetical protein
MTSLKINTFFRALSSYRTFEDRTKLPYREISSNKISLTPEIQDLLHRYRVKFIEKVVFFEDNCIVGLFLTTSKNSFEPLIMKNKIVKYLPELVSCVKEPDEFFFKYGKKSSFYNREKDTKRRRVR